MALNWKEISLILSELPLTGCRFGKIMQPTFHSVIWDIHTPSQDTWKLYAEVGTPSARLHRLTGSAWIQEDPKARKQGKKLRFVQFFQAHVEGALITAVDQAPGDRIVRLTYRKADVDGYIFIRLYSGAGANIFVTDTDLTIKDALQRRPQRDEMTGGTLSVPDFNASIPDKAASFTIRSYPQDKDFNSFIAMEHSSITEPQDNLELLRQQVEEQRNTLEAELRSSLRLMERRLEANKDYEALKHTADLLAAHAHLIQTHAEWVELQDWSREGHILTVALDPLISPADNIQAYYERYRKAKGAFEYAVLETERLTEKLQESALFYSEVLKTGDGDRKETRRRLISALKKAPRKKEVQSSPGIVRNLEGFTVLIGRNARENDELLRSHAKGNDWWLHTRDVPGGYVFIKNLQGKTIPLQVLLDAAQLSVYFSKARTASHADLYYTQVKYLKRVKGGKLGLVIPTQEKNIHVKVDAGRLQELLQGEDDELR